MFGAQSVDLSNDAEVIHEHFTSNRLSTLWRAKLGAGEILSALRLQPARAGWRERRAS
jgi:hypothetical protein